MFAFHSRQNLSMRMQPLFDGRTFWYCNLSGVELAIARTFGHGDFHSKIIWSEHSEDLPTPSSRTALHIRTSNNRFTAISTVL